MTKNEFMTILSGELKKKNIPDALDIIDEYEKHFTFKMSDGYSEEEIAARLGDPAALASQLGESGAPREGKTRSLRSSGCALPTYSQDCFSYCLPPLSLLWRRREFPLPGFASAFWDGLTFSELFPLCPITAA